MPGPTPPVPLPNPTPNNPPPQPATKKRVPNPVEDEIPETIPTSENDEE